MQSSLLHVITGIRSNAQGDGTTASSGIASPSMLRRLLWNLRSFNSLKNASMPILCSPMRRPNQIHPAAALLTDPRSAFTCVCESSFSSLPCEHPQFGSRTFLLHGRDQCASLRKCMKTDAGKPCLLLVESPAASPHACNVASRASLVLARDTYGCRGPLLYSSPSQSGNVVCALACLDRFTI